MSLSMNVWRNFTCFFLMGTSCTKNSAHSSPNPPIDQTSYPLDRNRFQHSSYDRNPIELNFIPDSERQWNSSVPLHVPQTLSVVKRSENFDYSPRMSTQQKYKCDQCGMVFPSDDSLFKHKARFCIGVKDSGINRQPIYSDDEDYPSPSKRTLPQKVIRHHSPVDRVCFWIFERLFLVCFLFIID